MLWWPPPIQFWPIAGLFGDGGKRFRRSLKFGGRRRDHLHDTLDACFKVVGQSAYRLALFAFGPLLEVFLLLLKIDLVPCLLLEDLQRATQFADFVLARPIGDFADEVAFLEEPRRVDDLPKVGRGTN